MGDGELMAHLRNILIRKCQTCGGKATVQLYGLRNEEYGFYCKKHGETAMKGLVERERTMYSWCNDCLPSSWLLQPRPLSSGY
jgi:hypothetical protein